ncbi:MAG TPA: acido-empty-quinoprotein group A [Candidatus Acidoferrales bacterium]
MNNKRTRNLLLVLPLLLLGAAVAAQGLDPALILKGATDSWPTYSGDYSGRRFSSLTQINQSNVKDLGLAWVSSLPTGMGAAGGGAFAFARGGGANVPTIIGGEAEEPVTVAGNNARVSGAELMINGILYMSAPDNAWAVDARDGTVLWHYFWKTKGGTHIGNRGLAMYHDWLFLETPDDYLISLDAKTGKERWHKAISDFDEQYFSTMAPVLIGNHLIVGTGDDLDAPGYMTSYDPETGDIQWKWYSEPEKMGDPGSDTWPNADSMRHGGAGVWVPGAYDPELHLYYTGTANPTPAFSTSTREGKDLYTSCLVAVNVETGKLAWYFQSSPEDTHDWDAAQTPILVDGTFDGKPRKMLLNATRNGYFFVIDRVTGQHLLTSKIIPTVNWTTGLDERGEPIRNPEKDASPGGSLVSPNSDGAVNWQPPSYDPQTGYFYVQVSEPFSVFYRTEPDVRAMQGLNGIQEQEVGSLGRYLVAVDYKTGKIAWKHQQVSAGGEGGGDTGVTTTAGHLLFTNDAGGNLVAYDPETGKPLWHTHLGAVSNAVETYMLDGHQYILVASGSSLYAFTLNN